MRNASTSGLREFPEWRAPAVVEPCAFLSCLHAATRAGRRALPLSRNTLAPSRDCATGLTRVTVIGSSLARAGAARNRALLTDLDPSRTLRSSISMTTLTSATDDLKERLGGINRCADQVFRGRPLLMMPSIRATGAAASVIRSLIRLTEASDSSICASNFLASDRWP